MKSWFAASVLVLRVTSGAQLATADPVGDYECVVPGGVSDLAHALVLPSGRAPFELMLNGQKMTAHIGDSPGLVLFDVDGALRFTVLARDPDFHVSHPLDLNSGILHLGQSAFVHRVSGSREGLVGDVTLDREVTQTGTATITVVEAHLPCDSLAFGAAATESSAAPTSEPTTVKATGDGTFWLASGSTLAFYETPDAQNADAEAIVDPPTAFVFGRTAHRRGWSQVLYGNGDSWLIGWVQDGELRRAPDTRGSGWGTAEGSLCGCPASDCPAGTIEERAILKPGTVVDYAPNRGAWATAGSGSVIICSARGDDWIRIEKVDGIKQYWGCDFVCDELHHAYVPASSIAH